MIENAITIQVNDNVTDLKNNTLQDFLMEIKKSENISFNELSINYKSDLWDFSRINTNNVGKSKSKFNFSEVSDVYKELLKDYVLISVFEGNKKLQTIYAQFLEVKKFMNFCCKNNYFDITDVNIDVISKYLETKNAITERCRLHVIRALTSFFMFYNYAIEQNFNDCFIDSIRNMGDYKLAEAEMKNNKTPNVNKDFFHQFLSTLVKVINDEKEDNNRRALSAMMLIETQTGLRPGELYALKVGCLQETIISGNRQAYFLEYETWKRHHNVSSSKVKIYANDIVKKAYDVLLELHNNPQKGDLLYPFKETPVFPSEARTKLISLFRDFNKYFDTVVDAEEDILGVNFSKLKTGKYVKYLNFTQIRVNVCTELYEKGCPLEYIEKFMSHLTSEMTGYYIRPRNEIQENLDESTKILRDIVTKEALPIGPTKGLVEKIDEFIKKNNFNVEKDLDVICSKLADKIPIRLKTGGVCIKSSRFRECAKDAATNEFYCAYGVCPNICTFYYMADISYIQAKELEENIECNKKRGCLKQAQKSLNMLHTLLKQKLIPQVKQIKDVVQRKGDLFVVERYPNIKHIVKSLDLVEEEIEKWKSMTL